MTLPATIKWVRVTKPAARCWIRIKLRRLLAQVSRVEVRGALGAKARLPEASRLSTAIPEEIESNETCRTVPASIDARSAS